jgi:hypothetical protein
MLDLLRQHPFLFTLILPIALFTIAITTVVVPTVLREVFTMVVANVVDSAF